MKNFKYFFLIFFCCSCNTKKNNVELSDLLKTTHQIVFYKDKIIRVVKPNIDGECCKKIQLLSKKLEIIDEIDCLEPYPSVSINNDSIIIVYSIFKSEENVFIGGYDYFKNKFPKIGNFKLYYIIKHIHGSLLGNDIYVDSIKHCGHSVLFFNKNKIIDRKDLQEIFFKDNYFYSISLHDSIREQLNFKPISDELYQNFFISLTSQ